ncbi:hypothetical protein PG984_012138 [Apiospora sp. TS-2023a]
MEPTDHGLDDDLQKRHKLLERFEDAANIGPGSDNSHADMLVETNTQLPALSQAGTDQPVTARIEKTTDTEETGAQIRGISPLANIEPSQPNSGYGIESLVYMVQAKEDGAAAPATDATEPVDLVNAKSSDVSSPEADTPGTTILEANTATKDMVECQNPAQPGTSEPSAQKHKRPRRGGRVRPSQRSWEETQFNDLESLIGIFEDDDNDVDNASSTDSSLSGNSSDRILDEDRDWTDVLLEDNDSDAMLDESPSRQEWLSQKRERNEHNEHLDRIMSMVGHEQVKAHFLDVKARVEAAKRWGEDVKSLKFDLILHGSDGTGKRRIAQLYAEFLHSIGAVPRRSFKCITGYSLPHKDDGSTARSISRVSRSLYTYQQSMRIQVIFFQNADQIDRSQEIEDILKAVHRKQDRAFLILSYRNLSEASRSALKATAESQARLPDPMRLKDYNENEMTQLLKRLVKTQSLEFEGQDDTSIRALARRTLRCQKRGGRDFGNIHALKLELELVCACCKKRLEKEWAEWAKTHSPTQDDNLDRQMPRHVSISREDIFGPEPLDIRSDSDAWKEIHNMIGLEGVKKEVDRLFTLAKVNYQRETQGEPPMSINLNRVFLGNPGVGKTTVSMLYGQIVAQLGFVTGGQVIMKNPGDLIGKYIGQSEAMTREALEEAKGNILIIDDAHMLHPHFEEDHRHGVIDTLVANISGLPGENRCVILSGYADEMEDMFLKNNPGLQRRFPLEDAIKFPSYNDAQLSGILDRKITRDEVLASEHARKVAHEILSRMRIRPRFGNGGDVENLLARAKLRQRDRLEAAGIDRFDMHHHPLEASDFDPDYGRSLGADKDRDELFAEFVGFETIVAQFGGYQKMTDSMRRHGIDPRPYVPWAFVFKGPPGTGKTSTAKKFGKLFYNMSFISSDEVITCSATDLIGRYIGHTGPKVISQFEQGLGKFLFIDEAYRLNPGSGGGGDFVRDAIGEMVDIMTKPRFVGNMVVILAGYEKDMEDLMQSNPGLRSRFPTHITFPHMTPEHCLQHLKQQLSRVKIRMLDGMGDSTTETHQIIHRSFMELSKTKGWANGRDVETLAKRIIQNVFIKTAEAEAEQESGLEQLVVTSDTIIVKLDNMLRERSGSLDSTASECVEKYPRNGSMDELNRAIPLAEQAVKATPEDHPELAGRLSNLAATIGKRFSRTGSMDDLNRAVQLVEQAVKATPEDHSDLAVRLGNLGLWLVNRFLRTGNMEDLNRAIQLAEQAVKATHEDSPQFAEQLSNLGSMLSHRFSRTGNMEDLNRAIQLAGQAVKVTPEDHPGLAALLSNLGILFGDRFSMLRSMDDLNRAIQLVEQAVKVTPEAHPDLIERLNNLGHMLEGRFLRLGSMDDLNRAIQLVEQAVKVTPEDHPDLAALLNNLANQLSHRSSRAGSLAHLQNSRSCSLKALNLTSAPISSRLDAGRRLLSSSEILRDIEQALTIANTAIQLVPLLASRSLQNTDKEAVLYRTAGLASDAAAVALQAGEGVFKAIEMLEMGRGLLMGSLYDIRTDVSTLEKVFPDLATEFTILREKLDNPILSVWSATKEEEIIRVLSEEGNQRREAADKLDTVIKKIRDCPGFERFLRCPSEDEICNAADYGPIVVINTSIHRCDAIIIEQLGIRVIPLQPLGNDIKKWDAESLETLQILWKKIVQSVLDALGFTQPPSNGQWPHVWWVPTGPLARFPLHAAGDHLSGTSDTTLDRVISSYNSSIRAIIHGRRHSSREMAIGKKIALVPMEETPRQNHLQFALQEASAVQMVCESMGISSIRPVRQKEYVLSALKACSLFHFAGHGGTSARNPLQSCLLLEDWEQDPLVVDDLLRTDLSSRRPFLAYLSACGTGQVQNEELIDEGLHLTAAYQLAGFRHVIGTLWSVDDRLCVEMASIMYAGLRDNGMNDQAVSQGLHFATRELRGRWRSQINGNCNVRKQGIRDERDAVIYNDEGGKMPALWVPYVHFGV